VGISKDLPRYIHVLEYVLSNPEELDYMKWCASNTDNLFD